MHHDVWSNAASQTSGAASRPFTLLGHRGLPVVIVLLTICAVGAPAEGQSHILTAFGTPSSGIGASFAVCGDIDGDGYCDMAAGNPSTSSGSSLAILFSGKDGSVLHEFQSPTQGIYFGAALAGGKDINADAVPDILVGAVLGSSGNPYPGSMENGSVFVYSGADMSLIREHVGLPGENLGKPLAFLDDIDGDGVSDYSATAAHSRYVQSGSPEAGEVSIWSGATGQLVDTKLTGIIGDGFGGAIQAIGDVDQDGVSDYCIGADGTSSLGLTSNGAVHLFSGATGSLIRVDVGVIDFELYGDALARIGDLDGDGAPDYVTSSWNPTNRAKVVSGASGAVISIIESPLGGPYFATIDVDTVDDWDGDGLPEVVLRNFGKSDSHLLVATALKSQPLYFFMEDMISAPDFPSGWVGVLNDMDGDGRSEIAVTNSSDSPSGAVYEFSTKSLIAFNDTIDVNGGSVIPIDLNGGAALAGKNYFLLAGVTGSSPGFTVGQMNVPLNFDVVTEFSIALANIPPFSGTFGVLDGLTGKAQAAFDMTSLPLPPAAVGVTFTFAYVVKGSVGSGNPGWAFASNAVEAVVVP